MSSSDQELPWRWPFVLARTGVGPVHADVPPVVVVKIAPHGDDVGGAPRVQGQVKANISDEVVKAFLPVQGRSREGEG